jgi:DNA-binding protein H-NS
MSIDELLKLRDDIGRILSHKAAELRDQLSRLGDKTGYKARGRRSSLRGRKVAIKYRDKSGNTWAGRGAQPIWLREKLKAGAKRETLLFKRVWLLGRLLRGNPRNDAGQNTDLWGHKR